MLAAGAQPPLHRFLSAAKSQIGKTVTYDPSYQRLAYPNGDVPIDRGVCTDVVIRALRAVGIDLQVLVHVDMRDNFSKYPQIWGLRGPDRNIDHRRVPNLATFLTRKRCAVTGPYKPGDIVTWRLSSGVPHIGIVSDVRVPGTDRHHVVHNVGSGAQLEDVLFAYRVTGHYRF